MNERPPAEQPAGFDTAPSPAAGPDDAARPNLAKSLPDQPDAPGEPRDAGYGQPEQPGWPRDPGPPPGPVGPRPVDSSPAGVASADGLTWRQRRQAKKAARKRRKAPWWELPALVALAIVIAVIVKSFVVQPFYIPSQSMEKTLHGCPGCHGDRILVNKPIYDIRDPHPGDIVVFNAPPGWNDEPASRPPSNPILRTLRGFGQLVGFVPPDGEVLVKRVIATGGQTVWGDAQGKVHVRTADGKVHVLVEPYVYEDGADSRETFGPVTVPKGRLWVMGDHRNDSKDSRYHCGPDAEDGSFGPTCDPTTSTVPIKDVIGKAFVIAWPPSRWRTLGTPSTFAHTAMAADSALPSLLAAGIVAPFYFVRRRRRRRAASG